MLTRAEIDFLKLQGLTGDDVYDARGQTSAKWKEGAREAGKRVILGTPCKAAGHRLRTRAGHCVQCDTAKLAYEYRHKTPGFVYIAGSVSLGLLKIGTAIDVDQRLRNLRNQKYANASDWVILFHARVLRGGEIEGEAQRSFQKGQRRVVYNKDGNVQEAQELFKVPFTEARNAILEAIGDTTRSELWTAPKPMRAEFE